jgi:hypothetical protein
MFNFLKNRENKYKVMEIYEEPLITKEEYELKEELLQLLELLKHNKKYNTNDEDRQNQYKFIIKDEYKLIFDKIINERDIFSKNELAYYNNNKKNALYFDGNLEFGRKIFAYTLKTLSAPILLPSFMIEKQEKKEKFNKIYNEEYTKLIKKYFDVKFFY